MTEPKIITVPWLPHFQALALFGRYIIVRTGYDKLIPHERVHIRQQREIGPLKYHVKWLFSREFRARVEIAAYTEADGKSPAEIIHLLRREYGVDLSIASFERLRSGE